MCSGDVGRPPQVMFRFSLVYFDHTTGPKVPFTDPQRRRVQARGVPMPALHHGRLCIVIMCVSTLHVMLLIGYLHVIFLEAAGSCRGVSLAIF